MTARFVVLGLARPRAAWFADVARWSTGAALPVEFIKCVSAHELRARVAPGRRFSAALLDAALTDVDRDLLATLREAGIAPIVVDDGHAPTDWVSIGALAVLPPIPGRDDVLDALAANATKVEGIDLDVAAPVTEPDRAAGRGQLVAVTGSGGVGVSTTSIALAQGMASHRRLRRSTLLADLALHAEQALLHDADDVVPGLPELLDAHRSGRLDPASVRTLTWRVEERGYDLLLGLRRASDWPTVRIASLRAALASLLAAWETVVADVDACVEGERATGSTDVQERHLLARETLAAADLVVVVGRPGMKWVHGMVRVIGDLAELGVDPARIQPVVLAMGRRPRARAEVTAALAALLRPGVRNVTATPIFLPGRDLDLSLRDGTRLPTSLVDPLARAVAARLEQHALAGGHVDGSAAEVAEAPRPIAPGELGFFVADLPRAPEPGGLDGEDAA